MVQNVKIKFYIKKNWFYNFFFFSIWLNKNKLNSCCFCSHSVTIYCLAKDYEDKSVLYRYAFGKRRTVFIVFINCHFSCLTQVVVYYGCSVEQGNYTDKISCICDFPTFNGTLIHV